MDVTHETPMSISTVIQPTNTPYGKGDCHFNSIMNWLSFDFFHEKSISVLQRDGVEHTGKCETHPTSVKCNAR